MKEESFCLEKRGCEIQKYVDVITNITEEISDLIRLMKITEKQTLAQKDHEQKIISLKRESWFFR